MLGAALHTNSMSKLCLSAGLCLFLGLVGMAPAVQAQEVKHAPTVEQCRADQKWWLDKVEDEHSGKTIGFSTLDLWVVEMNNCRSVDPENWSAYYNTQAEIAQTQGLRLFHFLDRHHLWDQFYTEEARGKR
jgi:hypothetical protein